MGNAAGFLQARPLQPQAPQPSLTEASKFTITASDVGTEAVRPGCMEDLEQQRNVLLAAARMALKRIEDGGGDAVATVALRAAVAAARPL